jgi:hypothetical protein
MVVSWCVVGKRLRRRAAGVLDAIKGEFDLSFKQIFIMNLFE